MSQTIEYVVEAVAKHKMGIKAAGHEAWINADKKANVNFSELHPGDVIKAVVDEWNGKTFVKKFDIVTGSSPLPASQAAASQPSRSPGNLFVPNQAEKSAEIARAVALKAAVDARGATDEELAKIMDVTKQFFNYLMNVKEVA